VRRLRLGRWALTGCSLLGLCLGLNGGARPTALAAAGRCVPKVAYSMGDVTCYRPA